MAKIAITRRSRGQRHKQRKTARQVLPLNVNLATAEVSPSVPGGGKWLNV